MNDPFDGDMPDHLLPDTHIGRRCQSIDILALTVVFLFKSTQLLDLVTMLLP